MVHIQGQGQSGGGVGVGFRPSLGPQRGSCTWDPLNKQVIEGENLAVHLWLPRKGPSPPFSGQMPQDPATEKSRSCNSSQHLLVDWVPVHRKQAVKFFFLGNIFLSRTMKKLWKFEKHQAREKQQQQQQKTRQLP